MQRYDGNSVRLFERQDELHRNPVTRIAENRDNRLWMLSGNNNPAVQGGSSAAGILDLFSYEAKTLDQAFGKALPFSPAAMWGLFFDERSQLLGFLNAPAHFSWWMLKGPGGIGKSRMVLELCQQALRMGYDAGF